LSVVHLSSLSLMLFTGSDNVVNCVAFQVAVVSKNLKQVADGKEPSMKVG